MTCAELIEYLQQYPEDQVVSAQTMTNRGDYRYVQIEVAGMAGEITACLRTVNPETGRKFL